MTDLDLILDSPPHLDIDLARRAHNWTSFTPEKRAQQAEEELKRHLSGTYEALLSFAPSEAQRALLRDEMLRYKAGYLTRYHAMLEAKSRTASPMVTGPARFPTARNQKRMETERRRGDELLEWQEKAIEAIRKKLLDARTPEQVSDDAFERIRKEIDRNLEVVRQIDSGEGRFAGFNRSSFVNSTTGKLRRMAEAGDTDTVARALAYIREQQVAMPKPFIAPRNGIWSVLQDVQTQKEETPAKSGEELIAEREGLRVVRNYDLDRLQLFFDEIPAATVREQLKRSGWNWSRTEGAWQRKITNNAEYAMSQVLEGFPKAKQTHIEQLEDGRAYQQARLEL